MNFNLTEFHFNRVTPVVFFLLSFQLNCQTISGHFAGLPGQSIKLMGFNGLETYVIDSTRISENGNFQLSYTNHNYGMGYLFVPDHKSHLLVLNGENIHLKADSFESTEGIHVVEGEENKGNEKYSSEYPRRERALSAWNYLYRMYRLDTLFTLHVEALRSIRKEIRRIQDEDSVFLSKFPKDSYIAWYLPKLKLTRSVVALAQERTEEIAPALAAFRAMDYRDARLYKSGLLRDALESHFWLIENSGRSLDSVFIEMKISIDHLIENLLPDQKKLNEISEYLFQLLEKRSLFKASEYLALSLLNERSCKLDKKLSDQLETYGLMKLGNTTPDFRFGPGVLAPSYKNSMTPEKLSDIKSNYTLIVFGASWCPQCPEDLSAIVRMYPAWRSQNVEVVFVSLDESETSFKNFTSPFPFISSCDYKMWESPIVKSYHVFSTPTMLMLNKDRKIILRPHSVSQLDSWIDWHLVKGNK